MTLLGNGTVGKNEMPISRADIIEVARDYIGTPFQHQGRTHKGLDCVGLPLCVAEDLGLTDKGGVPFKRNDGGGYSAQPTGKIVFQTCCDRMIRKLANQFRPGDVLCMRLPIEPCHVAIVTEYNGVPYIVHAYDGGERKCVEHILDVAWQRKIVAAFEFPGVTD